jgi:hypothetical protein
MEVLDGVQDALTFRMTGAPGFHQVWTAFYIPHTLQIQTPASEATPVGASGSTHENESAR